MLSNQPFYLSGDQDRACLLLHGLGGGVYEVQWLGEYLQARGWTVQADNYPGHENGLVRMPASTWEQWYAQSVQHFQKLQERYPTVMGVGFSTGCLLALHLANHYPVAKLALLSPYLAVRHEWYYLFPPEVFLFTVGYLIAEVPRQGPHVRDPAMRTLARAASPLRWFHLPTARTANQLIALVKTELPQIQTPTLIVQSPQDSVVAPQGAQYLYDHLGSRSKQLHWLKKSDHVITLDTEREEVFQRVLAFGED
jgi:carboxylesterase